MTTPDTVPTVSADEVLTSLKEKKDFIFEGDTKFSGFNTEFAYIVRYGDLAICFWCVHGQLYVRENPRPEWPNGVLLSVMITYGFSGLIPASEQIPCDDGKFFIACMSHGVQDDASSNVNAELLDLANEIMRKPGE